uniref:Uncharacterized protein n=1 Tax=Ciona savignyi TaxID=51511 RepID=H2Y5X5_CIOSA
MDYYKPPHKRRHGKSDDFKDESSTRHRNKQRKSESSSKRKSVLSPGHLKGISNQADVMSNIRCKIFSILGHEGGGTTQGKPQSRSPQASSDRDSEESIDEKLNGNTAKKLLGNTGRRITWNNDRKSPENNGRRLSRTDDRKSSRNTYKKSSGNTYRKSTGNMRRRTPSWERSLSPSSDEEIGCCHNDRLVDPPPREWLETKKSKFRDRKSWTSRRDSGNIRLERVIYNNKLNEANQSFDESKLSRYHRSRESTHEVTKPDHVIRDS